ncbi:HNH endonuclease [Actinomadura nitritigenes]|uniref:HNH endonuclease n=1 Tax=Actinomadura nitritigenes TaxID=134602 RepID=UPI003D90ADE5
MARRRIQRDPRGRKTTGSWRTSPLPADWPARVRAVHQRDQSCRWPISLIPGDVCGSTERLEVDHINGASNHELWNLQLLCRRHHALKTGRESAAARKAKRASRTRPAERHPGLIE